MNTILTDIALILKQELDNGDNDQIDGIYMADKLARRIADILPPKDQKTFLKVVRLTK